jgi:hypothetical protein
MLDNKGLDPFEPDCMDKPTFIVCLYSELVSSRLYNHLKERHRIGKLN